MRGGYGKEKQLENMSSTTVKEALHELILAESPMS